MKAYICVEKGTGLAGFRNPPDTHAYGGKKRNVTTKLYLSLEEAQVSLKRYVTTSQTGYNQHLTFPELEIVELEVTEIGPVE